MNHLHLLISYPMLYVKVSNQVRNNTWGRTKTGVLRISILRPTIKSYYYSTRLCARRMNIISKDEFTFLKAFKHLFATDLVLSAFRRVPNWPSFSHMHLPNRRYQVTGRFCVTCISKRSPPTKKDGGLSRDMPVIVHYNPKCHQMSLSPPRLIYFAYE